MAKYNLDTIRDATKQMQTSNAGPVASEVYTPPPSPTNSAGPAASAPQPQNAANRGVGLEQYITDWRNNFGVNLRQSEGAGWDRLLHDLQTEGYNATLDTRNDGMHKGIYEGGDPNKFIRLANGYDQPVFERSGGGAGGNVFSDPATSGWESLLRQVTGQLMTPQQTPGYDNLVAYLQKYMSELQGPAYTPGQSEVIQNQALDPMTQTRDAQKQQILEQAARRGLGPTSGPVLQMLQDVDKNYSQSRTQVQSGFAKHAIDVDKQQHGQAAQVGQMLQALQQGQLTGNEGRALQAVGLMGQIPALADSRLGAANQTMAATNAPLATMLSYILNQQGQQDQQARFDSAQNQAYWQQIGQLLGGMF